MAENTIVDFKKPKGKKRMGTSPDRLNSQPRSVSVRHMEDMHESLTQLHSLLNVLSNIDRNQDGPDPTALSETFYLLWELVDEIKSHYDAFWLEYDGASGQRKANPKLEEGDKPHG